MNNIESGSHGEPYRAEQIDYGEYSAYRIFAADGTRIAHIMSGQRLAAWLDHAILCVNACHKAGVRKPEELAECLELAKMFHAEIGNVVYYTDPMGLWTRLGKKLAALEGKDEN